MYTRGADGAERFYINGMESARGARKGDFSPWKTSYQFVLANERSGDRPWLGKYHLVAVYDRALAPEEVARSFGAGPD